MPRWVAATLQFFARSESLCEDRDCPPELRVRQESTPRIRDNAHLVHGVRKLTIHGRALTTRKALAKPLMCVHSVLGDLLSYRGQ